MFTTDTPKSNGNGSQFINFMKKEIEELLINLGGLSAPIIFLKYFFE